MVRSSWRPGPLEVRVPLKVVLAGEYAVLDDTGSGVACAVDRHVRCRARAAASGVTLEARELHWSPLVLRGPLPDGALAAPAADAVALERYRFAHGAAQLAYSYVAELGLPLRPLRVDIDSSAGYERGADGERVKLGLGTSAGVTVAVLGAVLAAHGVPIDRRSYRAALLRLALTAHARGQGGRGSGIDVATSVLGGVISYRRAKGRWFRKLEAERPSALEIARGGWPGLRTDPLRMPLAARVLVGFTGHPSATVDRVKVYDAWRRRERQQHRDFVDKSRKACLLLRAALESGDVDNVGRAIGWARGAISDLERGSGLTVETPLLRELATAAASAGGAGKLSGAGGGDCGIALAFTDSIRAAISEAWERAGILPIPVEIDRWGIVERRLDPSELAGAASGAGERP